jgi:hypothetical protein
MHPLLKLENRTFRKKEACAVMGGLRGSHHINGIVFKFLGLDDAAITEFTNILEEKETLQMRLHRLDLSNNPIGFHKTLRNPPTGHGELATLSKC